MSLFTSADETDFKKQFATQFLASYAATKFDTACSLGRQGSLETLPVEDAEYLANKAWNQLCYILNVEPNQTAPEKVILTEDFYDTATRIPYSKGTILKRLPSGQYEKLGARLGSWCISSIDPISKICKPYSY